MKEHIMYNDVIGEITDVNKKRVKEIIDKIDKAMMPIVNECENSEKGDECVRIDMYIRKGNDVLTSSKYHVNFGTSSVHSDQAQHLLHHTTYIHSSEVASLLTDEDEE